MGKLCKNWLVRWALAMLLMLGATHASVGDPLIDGSCPVCHNPVAWSLSDTGSWFQARRDLISKDCFLIYLTCEQCLYSGTPSDFERKLSTDFLHNFRQANFVLPEGIGKRDRWGSPYLAREISKLQGDTPQKRVFLSLNLARVLRTWSDVSEEGYGSLYGVLKDDYPIDLDAIPDFEQEWRRMEVDFRTTKDPERRHALSVALARTLCFLGEYDYLLQLLPQLKDLPPETADRVRALRDQERTLALEPALADALLAVEDPRTEKPAQMVYLVAELHRRLGHHDLAREWYNKALARPDLESQIRQWIPEQIQLMDGPKKPYSPLLPAIALAGVLTLLGWKQRSRDR